MKKSMHTILWATILSVALSFTVGCSDEESTSVVVEEVSSVEEETEENDDASSGEVVSSENSGYTYELLDDGTVAISGYEGTETNISVPSTLDGYVVSQIADHAFEANYDLITVSIPDGVTYIGEGAFMDCASLTDVSIPDTCSEVARAAFASCTSLTSITLPASVSVVLEEAFTACVSMETLVVGNEDLEYDSWGLIESGENLDVVIVCPVGSAIETWATENGFITQELS